MQENFKNSIIAFSIQKKGYNTVQVDDYINQLHKKMELLNVQVSELNEKLKIAEAKLSEYAAAEAAINATLINARLAAEKIIQEAELKAQNVRVDFNSDLEEDQRKITMAANELKNLKKRIKYILQSQLAMLEDED